jgi:hypothetical protein
MGHEYDMDMNGEGEGQSKFLDGWYDWEIVSMVDETSKNGNKMIVASVALADDATRGIDKVYLVSEPKKRWFLKNLLDAVGCSGSKDGVYSWSKDDVIGHTVSGRIQNNVEEWKGRDGKIHKSTKSQIVEWAAFGTEDKNKEEEPDL